MSIQKMGLPTADDMKDQGALCIEHIPVEDGNSAEPQSLLLALWEYRKVVLFSICTSFCAILWGFDMGKLCLLQLVKLLRYLAYGY
jgi:hypothetical protein